MFHCWLDAVKRQLAKSTPRNFGDEEDGAPMKLVAGLGNPGTKYRQTRHNIGFMVLRELANRHNGQKPKKRFHGETLEINVRHQRLLLLSPTTFMNRSGQSVAAAMHYYRLPMDDLLVVCDDLNLPVNRLRLKGSGSSGGQKGIRDIIRALGGEDFPRLRIGIGRPPEGSDPAHYVLSRFPKKEWPDVEATVIRAAEAVECWAVEGVEETMNRFNGPAVSG
jgi:PTH1 family peptidyl-tRNA hydrolase